MPASIASPRRALVVKLGHIGDVLVTTPVFTALKQAFSGIATTALVNQGTQEMVLNNPYVDQVLVLKRRHQSRAEAAADQVKLLRALRAGCFDLALELSGGDRGAFLSLISGAGVRVGFRPKRPHIRAKAFNVLVDGSGTQDHMVNVFLRQVRALGVEPKDTALKLYPGPDAVKRAEAILCERGLRPREFCLVHPTSRWMFKSWLPEKVAAAAGHLIGKGFAVVLTAAPSGSEMDFMAKVAARLDPAWPVVNLAGSLDLTTLGALIGRARLFFGVDSAPIHMAAALGTPVVVLFGPSGEKMWGPWQVDCEVVAKDWDCRPCGQDGCQGSKISRCLTELSIAEVTEAMDRLLLRA